MRLRKESWLHLAKALQPNSRRYCDHVDCGSGRTLVVSTGETGWSAHCFRCNEDGFEPYGNRNLAELHDVNFGLLQRKDLAFEKGRCELPPDFTKEIPDYAAIWLYKAGIYKSTAEAYRFGWSDSLKRVILPVYDKEALVFMQARSIDGRKPKYLNNSAISKASVLFRSAGSPTLRRVVVTEDILSSVRVGVHVPAVSTLGTSLSDEQAYWIASHYDEVAVWFDPDGAGKKGSSEACKKLRLLGVRATCTSSDKDPKCYSNREMLSILTRSTT